MSNSYDLPQNQQRELIDRQLENLRADRFQRLIDIRRWESISEEQRDGSERPAIEHARAQVAVIEGQIDALLAL